MLRLARTACAVLLASSLTPFAFAQNYLPTPSTWTLNLQESSFGAGPSMKSDVLVMLVHSPKWAKYTDTTVIDGGTT